MIILTGAAGFIGSCLLSQLNEEGIKDIVIVDDFSKKEKEQNYSGKDYLEKAEREELFEYLKGKETRLTTFCI